MRRAAAQASAILVATDRDGRVLLVRQRGGPFAGAWLLPGGRVAAGEAVEDALRREVREETGMDTDQLEPYARYEVRALDESFRFRLHAFRGRVTGTLRAEEGSEVAWREPREIVPHPVLARELNDAGVRAAPRAELEAALLAARIGMRAIDPP